MKKVTIPEINPFIVGAGGVASYLLPVLIKTFPIPNLWIRDGDKLEERNLDRQHFTSDQIGHFKAEALIKNSGEFLPGKVRSEKIKAWNPETRWFTEGELPPEKADLVICVADNHTARRACLEAAESANIPCIIGGNEYYDSQALWVDPMDFHTPKDPFNRYPEMKTDTTADPVRCTGEEQVIHPQLAIANLRCASHILDLIWLYRVVLPSFSETMIQEIKKTWPHEIFTSTNNCEYIRHG